MNPAHKISLFSSIYLFIKAFVSRCVCVCVSSISLLSGTTTCSRFILCISSTVLNLVISPRRPGSFFFWRMVLKNKIWVLVVFAAAQVSLFLGPLWGESKKYYGCILTCVRIDMLLILLLLIYAHINKYVCVNMCIYTKQNMSS